MKQKTLTLILSLLTLSILLGAQNSFDNISIDSVPPYIDRCEPVRVESIYPWRIVIKTPLVITGTRSQTDPRYLPMTISLVDNKQIRNSYQQSLMPIINEQVPGIFVTSRGILGYGVSGGGSGGIKIRGIGGSGTTGVLVLVDGQPQYMGLMGHPLADAYQSMLANKVEVLRGPASVLYGSNAMGGVINIVSHKFLQDGRQTNVRLAYGSYNTLMTEAINRYRKGRFSNVLTASYNRTDGHRKNMQFQQMSGYTKLGYELSDTWKAFADANITHFNASNPGSITIPLLDNDSHITRGATSLSIENNYKNTSGLFKFFYNWGHHKINDGYAPQTTPKDFLFHSKDIMLGASWYQNLNLFTGNHITAGVDFQHFGGEAWNKYNDGRRADLANKTQNEIAAYLSMRQDISEILTLDAGIRIDHHSQAGTVWIPQAGLVMHLPKMAALKAMVSKGFRNPTIREMYMFPPQNPNLRPEKTMNYELSYSQRFIAHDLFYAVSLFYINGDNIIQTIRVDGRPFNTNIAKVKNWGAEANVSYRINATWMLNANYSWLRMKYPVVGAPQHKLYAGVDFSKGKWNASAGVQYIDGLYTDIESDPKTKENFLLLNARGSYQMHRIASVFVKGENLLAQRYEINAGYPMPKATVMCGVSIDL